MKPSPPLLQLCEGRRVRPRGQPKLREKELVLHKAVVKTLLQLLSPGWKFWHTPNGGARTAKTGALMKALGTLPGVPDLVLISPAGIFHGLELKAEHGRLSEAQERFQSWANEHDIAYEVADNFDQALAVLQAWDAIRELR